MADEGRGVALAILGIVAVIGVVGLVLLFSGATGRGIYGGQMRQGESDIRQYYEEPGRYTSPVPPKEGGTFYQHRQGEESLIQTACPDKEYPVFTTPAHMKARNDCIPSASRDVYWCCRLGGQAGGAGIVD